MNIAPGTVYVDLETAPPRRWSVAEILDHEQRTGKPYLDLALSMTHAEIVAVGIAYETGEAVGHVAGDYEGDTEDEEMGLLNELDVCLAGADRVVWAGWNHLNFDLPIIRTRALRYGLTRLAGGIPARANDGRAVDVMRLMAGTKWPPGVSQEDAARALGIDGKPDGMRGAMVPALAARATEEDWKKIRGYVAADVHTLRAIHTRIVTA